MGYATHEQFTCDTCRKKKITLHSKTSMTCEGCSVAALANTLLAEPEVTLEEWTKAKKSLELILKDLHDDKP